MNNITKGLTLIFVLGLATCLVAATTPPLVDAARSGDVDAIRTMIAQGVDINEPAPDGATALLWASYQDDVDTSRVLIAAGADPNAANDLGATPLWAASQNGNEVLVSLLLAAEADADKGLLLGETPLMVASRSGYPEVVEHLIASGADPNVAGARNQTALMWAVAQKHPAVVDVLISGGADIHARTEVWSQVMGVPPHSHDDYNREIPHGGETALMFAARVGDLASARLLVGAGADVNDSDAWSVSATTLAAHSGFGDLVGYLLEEGANPNAEGPGFTALHNAIMNRDDQMVLDLLDHGADPEEALRTWTPTRRSSADLHFPPQLIGASPLWLAARFSTPETMRLLAERGADPQFVHRSEYVSATIVGESFLPRINATTPLMAALGMGGGSAWVQADRSEREPLALEAAELAIELGIDINFADTDGRTALDAATRLRYESVVNFLVEHGAERGPDDESN